jgi:hypothetical protein
VHGGDDGQTRPGHGADVLDGQRGVSALDAVGAHRQRDVHAVVHDEKGAGGPGQVPEAATEEGEVGRPQVLLPRLDGGEPGREALADDGDELQAPGQGAVGDATEGRCRPPASTG